MRTETTPGPLRRIDNMSAPPRSTVNVRPLRAPADADTAASNMHAPGACGLQVVARVSLDQLIRLRIPRALAQPRTTTAGGLDPAIEPAHRRLLAAVVLARRVVGGCRAGFAAMRVAAAQPPELLEDEFVALMRTLDGRDLHLPAFGFFRDPPDAAQPAIPRETNLARALFIAAHRYGELFLRDADPIPQLFGRPQELISATEGGVR